MEDRPSLLYGGAIRLPRTPNTSLIPHQWTPRYIPDDLTYIDGSDIKGNPRLGAAVVRVPTRTILYIDAGGTYETRTIMRAEHVAIHPALDTFAAHEWIDIFTDYVSSLQAIRHTYTNSGNEGPRHNHHHSLLLGGIINLLEDGRRKGLVTTLHKSRSQTDIRGNDLADAVVKLAVTSYESLPSSQTLYVDIGEIAQCPPAG